MCMAVESYLSTGYSSRLMHVIGICILLLLHVHTVAVAAVIDFSVCSVVADTKDTAAVVMVVAVIVTVV